MAKRVLHLACGLVMITAVFSLLAGCTAIDQHLASAPDDVAPAREERERSVADSFKASRDNALYQAAVGRWRAGDTAACESLLQRLLQRNDKHRESRLLLADLYISTHKPKAAEKQLRLLVERMPDDAQVHHSLGLLLDVAGNTQEALTHLETAAELEPDNELYALSHATTLVGFQLPSEPEKSSSNSATDETPVPQRDLVATEPQLPLTDAKD